ncbi:CopG family transcriptional regulator [Salmonella enterica subsp. enterica serovar Bareilly]
MTSEGRAGVSANANSEWVAFTAKLPQALKKKLKVIAAECGQKQQEIVAEAVEQWMTKKGFDKP